MAAVTRSRLNQLADDEVISDKDLTVVYLT